VEEFTGTNVIFNGFMTIYDTQLKMRAFIVCKVFDMTDFYILHIGVHGVDDQIVFIRYDCRWHAEQEAF
jgi:hypothetical protein